MSKQCPRILGSAWILRGQLVYSSVSRNDSPFSINLNDRTNSLCFTEYWKGSSVDQNLKTPFQSFVSTLGLGSQKGVILPSLISKYPSIQGTLTFDKTLLFVPSGGEVTIGIW